MCDLSIQLQVILQLYSEVWMTIYHIQQLVISFIGTNLFGLKICA